MQVVYIFSFRVQFLLTSARDSATNDDDKSNGYLSRAKGYNDLNFSQITKSAQRLRRHTPNPQKWAKAKVAKNLIAG